MVGPASAKKITDQILASLERLKKYPLSGGVIFDEDLSVLGYRFVTSEKYICIYRVLGENVFVYHVTHGSRDYSRLFNV